MLLRVEYRRGKTLKMNERKKVPDKTKVEELNLQISKNKRSLEKIHNNKRIMSSRTMKGEKLS